MTSLLLLSSSTVHGSGYLDHAESELRDFFGEGAEVLFVPHARHDVAAYSARARERFTRMGMRLTSLAEPGSESAISNAGAFFVGGGNTFRLLKLLRERGWLDAIRSRIEKGALYGGASAGTNLACPSIRTTNDMPIVEPGSLSALGLLPFQVNPHYLDPDAASTHQGETRDERLRQFHEEAENERPVLALREGTMLRRRKDRLDLRGQGRARLFRRGREPREVDAPAELSELLTDYC
jgi:dipeptidase E